MFEVFYFTPICYIVYEIKTNRESGYFLWGMNVLGSIVHYRDGVEILVPENFPNELEIHGSDSPEQLPEAIIRASIDAYIAHRGAT